MWLSGRSANKTEPGARGGVDAIHGLREEEHSDVTGGGALSRVLSILSNYLFLMCVFNTVLTVFRCLCASRYAYAPLSAPALR